MTEAGEKWVKEVWLHSPPIKDNSNPEQAERYLRAFVAEYQERVEAAIGKEIRSDWDREDVELASGADIRLNTFAELVRELLGDPK